MINDTVQAIILAAGKSSRFNNNTSKLVANLCGKEMIAHTTALLEKMHIPTTIVVGHKRELVEIAIKKHHPHTSFNFVQQTEQLGTGHALSCTKHLWKKEHIIVLNGDTPLINQELLQALVNKHVTANAAMSVLVAHNIDPSVRGYGHIIQDAQCLKIVEDKHLEYEPTDLCTLNGGIYVFKRSFLLNYIDTLPAHEKSGEFYLPILLEIASRNGLGVALVDTAFDTIRGVNTLKELWVAEQIKRAHIIEHWMINGVRFMLPQTIHIDESVTIGCGSIIGAGVQLCGNTNIGEYATIGTGSILNNARIGNHCAIDPYVIIAESTIGEHDTVRSFTLIEAQSTINDHCTIPSFTHAHTQHITQTTQKQSTHKKKGKTFVAAFKAAADQTFAEGT